MSGPAQPDRVVSASRDVAADSASIFRLLAEPSEHPRWDGNDNLSHAEPGQRIRAVGDVFTTRLTRGSLRQNHVVEFVEGRLLAWCPAEVDSDPIGHLWRWQVEPLHDSLTRVIHTYDWTQLTDESRLTRAEWTTADRLSASLDRLATLAERAHLEGGGEAP